VCCNCSIFGRPSFYLTQNGWEHHPTTRRSLHIEHTAEHILLQIANTTPQLHDAQDPDKPRLAPHGTTKENTIATHSLFDMLQDLLHILCIVSRACWSSRSLCTGVAPERQLPTAFSGEGLLPQAHLCQSPLILLVTPLCLSSFPASAQDLLSYTCSFINFGNS
jgi:hypothetical protein